ncbi:hypothetical protein [Falsiruegeria litorea]|uniref:hypothetical protein n=1 Tax=Falsiruegeria litorea TaxID=1280831 RepID=UPI001BFD69F6|nr:hypothetical protein [Falsiruegeria litorea]MBT8169670.1 hypothetical protein [Falsiruegeria litorea]
MTKDTIVTMNVPNTNDTADFDLAAHEVGHVFAAALSGADLILVQEGSDSRGDFAVTHGVSTSTTPPGAIAKTPRFVIAGSMFSVLFDSRFSGIDDAIAIQMGHKALDVANLFGICPDDAEDAEAFSDADLYRGAVEIAALGIANKHFVASLADHIVACFASSKPATFSGAGILAMLNGRDVATLFAGNPHLVTKPDSRANAIDSLAAEDTVVAAEVLDQMRLAALPQDGTPLQ